MIWFTMMRTLRRDGVHLKLPTYREYDLYDVITPSPIEFSPIGTIEHRYFIIRLVLCSR